jgi:hypothetical protein
VTPTQIVSTTGQIIVSDIFNLEVAYAPNASSLVPPFETEDYDDWFFTLSTKLDKAQSITVAGALPTLTGDVYDDRYFYVENEGVGRLYYINGSTAIEVVWQVGTLRLTPTGNGDITADTGKLSWNQPNGTAQLGLYNDVNIGLGEDVVYYGKASATITKGQVIQFGGYQGDHILIKPAVPSEINANPKLIMGIAKQAITSGDFGYVAHFGKIEGYDSGAFAVGSLLWFNSSSGSNGLLTATQPTAPNAKILMAALIKAETSGAANNGVLQVRIDIEPKLEELQDVLITSVASGNVLSYDGTKWVNSTRLTTAESDIDALEGRMTTEEGNVDSLEGRMTTAESNIVNIEDGTTVVQKALSDQNNDVIDTTYLKIASATATYIPLSQKGVANGVAPLGADNKIPSIHLPGGVDDIKEFANLASFPVVGEASIIYVALDTNVIYRWSGTAYVEISSSLALGQTSSTAFPGDRGLALETLTDNIVDGDQALALKNQVIRNTVVGTSPLVVNSIASTTANLTEFQVDGVKKLEVTKDGFLTQNGTRLFSQPVDNTNTFFGSLSGTTNATGNLNTGFGGNALDSLTTGSSNTGFGYNALESTTTGTNNTGVGVNAGRAITTGSINTFIGLNSGHSGAWGTQLSTASNSTALGFQAFTDKSNQMVFGNASVTEFKFDRNASAVLLAPRIENVSSSSNIFKVTTLTNNAMVENINLISNTSGSIADGFGSSTNFYISLSDASLTRIGSIGATRSGAGSGRLTFLTNNAGSLTEKMTILPNGNVGIGDPTPSTKLVVNGGQLKVWEVGNSALKTYSAEAGVFIVSYQSELSPFTKTTDIVANADSTVPSNIRFLTKNSGASNPTEKVRILENGNVGIGTASPTYQLSVVANANDGGLEIRRNSTTTNDYSSLNFRVSSAEGTQYHAQLRAVRTNRAVAQDTDLLFGTFSNNAFGERMRIRDDGNVGLGTSSPVATSKLTIRDASIANIRTENTVGGFLEFGISSNADSIGFIKSNYYLNFITNNVTRMYIDSANGGVGIGTGFDTPTAQLQVKSGATTRVPLIVDTLASHATNLQEWRVNGATALARIEASGNFISPQIFSNNGICNVFSQNNSFVNTSLNGTVISRNIADTNPALIVNLANASATGNIQVWQKAGTALASITNGGAFASGTTMLSTFKLGVRTNTNRNFVVSDSSGSLVVQSLNDANNALVPMNIFGDTILLNPTGGGNVGVGTASPSVKFEVNGIAKFDGTPSNEQTGDYTLVLTDKGKVLRVNSATNRTVTIPLNSSVAFPIDTEIAILRYGTGTVSISPTAGVTLQSKAGERKISGQYGSVALKKIGTDEWVLVGSLEA